MPQAILLLTLLACCRPCQPSAQNQPSGFGFELTFRLLSDDQSPPTWPAQLLQAIARYVFASGNTLCVGDHISWHSALDQADSSVQHILLTADPQLKPLKGPLGSVSFIQVGKREREMGGKGREVAPSLNPHRLLVLHMKS